MYQIRELRRMAGLTQIRLAHLSGVSRTKLSLAECEQIVLTTREAHAVRAALIRMIQARATEINGVLISAESDTSGEILEQ